MEILVPAAGLSTRFPDLPPKYLLVDDNDTRMIENAVGPYIGRGDMYVGVLKEHNEKYNAEGIIGGLSTVPEVIPIILPEKTKGPADTVYQMCKFLDQYIDDGAFLVKDCDSFFDHDINKGNYVCVADIHDHAILRNLGAKSFVQVNEHGLVTNIVEKKVISEFFCVGGYKFEKRSEFMAAYEAIQDYSYEIFVSHVIQHMIAQGKQFFAQSVCNYVDVGTIDEWNDYLRNKK